MSFCISSPTFEQKGIKSLDNCYSYQSINQSIASNYRLNQVKHNFEINVNDPSPSRVGSYGNLGIEVDEIPKLTNPS